MEQTWNSPPQEVGGAGGAEGVDGPEGCEGEQQKPRPHSQPAVQADPRAAAVLVINTGPSLVTITSQHYK